MGIVGKIRVKFGGTRRARPHVAGPLDLVADLAQLLERISYKPHTGFHVDVKGPAVFVQHWQRIRDCKTGEKAEQRGRKFYISPYMTDGEVVRTCALAVKVFEEHEANEWLRFDGERVLDPHPEGPRPDQR